MFHPTNNDITFEVSTPLPHPSGTDTVGVAGSVVDESIVIELEPEVTKPVTKIRKSQGDKRVTKRTNTRKMSSPKKTLKKGERTLKFLTKKYKLLCRDNPDESVTQEQVAIKANVNKRTVIRYWHKLPLREQEKCRLRKVG